VVAWLEACPAPPTGGCVEAPPHSSGPGRPLPHDARAVLTDTCRNARGDNPVNGPTHGCDDVITGQEAPGRRGRSADRRHSAG